MSQNKKQSKLAVSLTALYLLAIIASLVVMLTTAGDTAMSGIFLVIVTMPWVMVLTWAQELLHIDSMVFTTVFLVFGGLLNSVILYQMVSFVTGGYKH